MSQLIIYMYLNSILKKIQLFQESNIFEIILAYHSSDNFSSFLDMPVLCVSAPLLRLDGGRGILPRGFWMSDIGDSRFFQALLALLGGRSPVLMGGILDLPEGGFLNTG